MLQRSDNVPSVVSGHDDHSTGSARPDLTYEDFQKLADIARVPEAKRQWLYDRVCSRLQKTWEIYEPNIFEPFQLRLRLERAFRRSSETWDVLTKAAANHLEATKRLREAEIDALRQTINFGAKAARFAVQDLLRKPTTSNLKAVEEYTEKLEKLSSTLGSVARVPKHIQREKERARIEMEYLKHLASEAKTPRRGCRIGDPRERGRVTGSFSVRNKLLGPLVRGLRVDVAEVGGRLSFNKENENKGELCQVLKFLAPFLPPNLIPQKIPLGTIARLVGPEARD